jgi:hypothetical protein
MIILFEIRGFYTFNTPTDKYVNIVVKTLRTGEYTTYKYPCDLNTNTKDVFIFLAHKLNCHLNNIIIAHHIDFKKVKDMQ